MIGSGDGRREGHEEDVAVLDVGELVGEHAPQLAVVAEVQDSLGRGDDGVRGVPAGREGVRGRAGDDREAGADEPEHRGELVDGPGRAGSPPRG